jgi:hypothetical protein
VRRLLVLAVSTGAALLVAPTALAGSLPGPGAWIYNGSTKKVPSIKMFVQVNPPGTQSFIYSLQGFTAGKCKKSAISGTDFNVDTNRDLKIPIKPSGTFSSKWIPTIGDAAGEKGKVKIKGTFNGTKVSGTVTARQHGGAFGKCSASRKKYKAKGEQVG